MKKLLFLLAVVPMVLVSCNQKTDPDNPGGTDDPNNPGKTETPDQSEKYGITATDMGLSVLWADKNIGALDDKEPGEYFAWGEIIAKTEFRWENYKYGTSKTNLSKYTGNSIKLDASDDVATVKLGGKWRMPTTDEWDEIATKCKWTWVSEHNVYGAQAQAADGTTIFFPAGGGYYGKLRQDYGMYGFYWTADRVKEEASNAWSYYIREMQVYHENFERFYGFMIRPVRDK